MYKIMCLHKLIGVKSIKNSTKIINYNCSNILLLKIPTINICTQVNPIYSRSNKNYLLTRYCARIF